MFRELAYQIADQFRVFGKHIGLKDTVIVGGIGKLMLYVACSYAVHIYCNLECCYVLKHSSLPVQYNVMYYYFRYDEAEPGSG